MRRRGAGTGRLGRRAVLAAVVGSVAGCTGAQRPAAPVERTVEGRLVWHDRLALPAGTGVVVRVVSVGGPQEVTLAERRLVASGQGDPHFTLAYDPQAVPSGERPVLEAVASRDGVPWLRTPERPGLDAAAAYTRVDLLLRPFER